MHRSRRRRPSRSRHAQVLCALAAVRDCRHSAPRGRRRAGDERERWPIAASGVHEPRGRTACGADTSEVPEWSDVPYPWSDDELYGW